MFEFIMQNGMGYKVTDTAGMTPPMLPIIVTLVQKGTYLMYYAPCFKKVFIARASRGQEVT
jgi:hypothetical protein